MSSRIPSHVALRSKDYELHASNVYHSMNFHKPVADGWNYRQFFPDPLLHQPSGFDAAFYENGIEVVLAFAGTDAKSGADWATDVLQGWGRIPAQYHAGLTLAQEARIRLGIITLIYTGHSLGGGLACYAGLRIAPSALRGGNPGGNKTVWHYNAAALGEGCEAVIKNHHGNRFREVAAAAAVGINVAGEILSNLFFGRRNFQPIVRRIRVWRFSFPYPILTRQLGTVYFVTPAKRFSYLGPYERVVLHYMHSVIAAMNKLRQS